MLSHTFPFKGLTNDEIFHSIKREKLKFEGIIWDGISETAKDFIAKLLTKSPVIRMTAVDALEHPYLQQVSNSSGNPKQNKKIIS
jgi:serine/threonine protein kinase